MWLGVNQRTATKKICAQERLDCIPIVNVIERIISVDGQLMSKIIFTLIIFILASKIMKQMATNIVLDHSLIISH